MLFSTFSLKQSNKNQTKHLFKFIALEHNIISLFNLFSSGLQMYLDKWLRKKKVCQQDNFTNEKHLLPPSTFLTKSKWVEEKIKSW